MKKFEIKTKMDFVSFMSYVNFTLKDWMNRNEEFKAFDVTIEEHIVKRTNLQNNYYWANASSIAKLLNDKDCFVVRMGVQCEWTKEDVDRVNKTKFCVESTTRLSTKEFCDLMENTFAFWIDKTKGEWKPLETAESYFANNK